MSTLTLTAKQLTTLTASVIPHVSTDRTIPVLNSVLVRTSGKYVTALGTDRYRIGMQRVALDEAPDPDFRALIPLHVLAQINRVFKATKAHDPLLKIEHTVISGEHRLQVSVADGIGDGVIIGGSLSFVIGESRNYPRIDRLIHDAIKAKPEPTDAPWSFAANPVFMSRFAKGQPIHAPMIVSPTTHPNKPWMVRVGDDFIGLIVPTRFQDGDPYSASSTWLDLLPAPATETEAGR